ncbi:ABC transporter substrate-binding protein [Vallitalea okinawensis]|uniref:ABC transporter substrate-binding protein n=1 Tax=Vallitalea okinawensis TaxID=2078660 RepID=UPI000CFB5BAE|nr:ABC transporter substrate-binding protein [Vallitalea okinawensis]
MKKIAILLTVLISIILILPGCQNTKKETIRLNEVVRSIFYAPQYVALEKGFFEEEGLEIELSTGWGADKSMAALLSNNAEIALMGPEASIYVYNEGQENYAISFAQLTQRAGNFLIGREPSPDFQWEDVKGKTIIGGRPGGMPQLVLEYILKQNGIEPFSDVEIITNIQFSATAGSFVGGTGDYTAEFEPTASKLENEETGYVVASLGTASGKVPYTTYMATKEYLAGNEDVIQGFTNAIYKGQIWVEDHTPAEIAEVIQPYFEETDLKLITQIVERYKSQDTWRTDPYFDEGGYDLLLDILETGGQLEKAPEFEVLVNNTYAEKTME